MDFATVVSVSALLLAAVAVAADAGANIVNATTQVSRTVSYDGAAQTEPTQSSNSNNNNNNNNNNGEEEEEGEEPSRPPPPVLGVLAVSWTGRCKGRLVFYHRSNSSHVCRDSEASARRILYHDVCDRRRGCKGAASWSGGKEAAAAAAGFHVSEEGARLTSSCEVLEVQCEAETEVVADVDRRQLQIYRAVTALLCCVLLLLLLMRFSKPTVRALQKRLSDRRQSRWVGPTQSHSVSYHRGKSAVKNNDREQRLSYPALERLTLSDSREPSSNRNSDCNF